jgi:hypothetical protein
MSRSNTLNYRPGIHIIGQWPHPENCAQCWKQRRCWHCGEYEGRGRHRAPHGPGHCAPRKRTIAPTSGTEDQS